MRVSRLLIVLLIALGGTMSGGHRGGARTPVYIDLAVLGLTLVVAVINWLVTRWRVEEGVLRIESGLLRRSSRRFPADQMQAIDIVSPATARVFGLSEIRVRMASSTGGTARMAYLPEPQAEALRARLLAVAHGVAEHTPPPPEQILYSIPTDRLAASLLLSVTGVLFLAVVAGLAVVAAVAPGALPAVISGGFTWFVVVVTAFFRRFNGDYQLTVAEAPDGLRLRSGLFQTASETIPYARVQGARMIEPVLWRPFGWCRVVVDVAGRQKRNRENRTVSGPLRAVLPVGSRHQADWIIQRLFPGAPPPGTRPPARVRWKSPLRFPNLSWGRDDNYAITTSGRLVRVTDWVPLGKVQSIRRVVGPLQRRFRVATIHLDTAGRNIHAVARDRDEAEAERLLEDLPVACRARRGGVAQPGSNRAG